VVIALLAVGDLVARGLAGRQLRDRARDAVPGATGAEAETRSFPFVGRLLVDGSVPYVRVRVNHVGAGAIAFTFVQVELNGVHLDRNQLFRHRQVRLTSLDRGTATAEISDSELSRLLGVQISSQRGQLTVTREKVTVPGRAEAHTAVVTLAARALLRPRPGHRPRRARRLPDGRGGAPPLRVRPGGPRPQRALLGARSPERRALFRGALVRPAASGRHRPHGRCPERPPWRSRRAG